MNIVAFIETLIGHFENPDVVIILLLIIGIGMGLRSLFKFIASLIKDIREHNQTMVEQAYTHNEKMIKIIQKVTSQLEDNQQAIETLADKLIKMEEKLIGFESNLNEIKEDVSKLKEK